MTRRRLFEILRKVDTVMIVLSAILIPVFIVLAVSGLGASLLNDMGMGMAAEYAMAMAIIPIGFILVLLIDRFILRILAATQSAVLIIIIIALYTVLGLSYESLSIPIFHVIALFLPKE